MASEQWQQPQKLSQAALVDHQDPKDVWSHNPRPFQNEPESTHVRSHENHCQPHWHVGTQYAIAQRLAMLHLKMAEEWLGAWGWMKTSTAAGLRKDSVFE
ncbi:unnamed protein product [Symbiodinium natans]|uniref:Uncharacterized protein n=1 Tax=Symbiodinium natans TaxID=878477 RepID=A0A812SLJ5_9DINO|nr:unnamed protein product [Symbiodinium natans]